MAGGPTKIMCFSFVGVGVDVVNLILGKKLLGQNFWKSVRERGMK